MPNILRDGYQYSKKTPGQSSKQPALQVRQCNGWLIVNLYQKRPSYQLDHIQSSVIAGGNYAAVHLENKTMRKCINEIIYDKLEKLGVTAINGDAAKSVIDPDGDMMDLNYDNLGSRDENQRNIQSYDIALAHNYIQNGDVMADPDMEIRIYPEARYAEALTYQLDGLGIFQRVYPEPGKVYPKLKKDLNQFLNQWLKNCIDQGHTFTSKKVAA